MNTRKIAFAGIIGALYAALTIALSFIGYGPIQFRIAEALCILPFFFPFTAWGLFIGCVVANLLSPYPLDIAVGTVATLLAAFCTAGISRFGRERLPVKLLACLPPVIINALAIGALLAYYTISADSSDSTAVKFLTAFLINGAQVGFGELVVMYALGLPLMIYLPKSSVFQRFSAQLLALD